MLPFETRSLSYSITFHAILLLVAAVGLPMLLPDKPDPMPMVMTVEILPMSEMTNIKPSDAPLKDQPEKEVKQPPKPTPPPPTPPKAEPAKPTPPKPAPAEDKKPFDPMEGAEPLPDKTKEKPKEETKEKPKDKPKEKSFDDLMKELNTADTKDNVPTHEKPTAKTTEQATTKSKSDAPYDPGLPLSISEKDAIRSQFIPCWRMPAGAKDAHNLAVRVKVTAQPDGTVLTAVVAPDQMGRYNSDTFFRAAADSAVRAVQKCNPLQHMPADKYNSWREMELNFDPADLM